MLVSPGNQRPHLIGKFFSGIGILYKRFQLFLLFPLGFIGGDEKPGAVPPQARFQILPHLLYAFRTALRSVIPGVLHGHIESAPGFLRRLYAVKVHPCQKHLRVAGIVVIAQFTHSEKDLRVFLSQGDQGTDRGFPVGRRVPGNPVRIQHRVLDQRQNILHILKITAPAVIRQDFPGCGSAHLGQKTDQPPGQRLVISLEAAKGSEYGLLLPRLQFGEILLLGLLQQLLILRLGQIQIFFRQLHVLWSKFQKLQRFLQLLQFFALFY